MTINREHLEPCPFCGGEPNLTHDDYVHDDLRPMPVVECKSCSAWVRAEDWNRRTQAQAAPEAEPVALPDGVHIDKDFLGTVHIKFGEFDFIQIQYDHRYTYNSHQDWVARRIVASLAEDSPDVSQWRGLAAALYQACGAYDMPPRVLDALSAAANGEQFGHLIGALLPCSPTAPQHDAELVELLIEIDWTMRSYFPGENPPAHERLMARIKAKLATLRHV